jgi:hypothetical protein
VERSEGPGVLRGRRDAGEVGRFEFPPVRFAEIDILGAIDLEQRALDHLTAMRTSNSRACCLSRSLTTSLRVRAQSAR